MGALNTLSGNSSTVDFNKVTNDICYAINSGSVTDVIGDSFDLVQTSGTCPFTIKVGDTEYTATADATTANLWNFNTGDSTSNPYTVEYKPATETEKEQLVWTINVPVENLNRVSLSYTLKLVNKQTAAGTYTPVTNESATLDYINSNGEAGTQEIFEQPTVTYKVAGSNGGGGGSYTPTPSPSPTAITDPEVPGADLPTDLDSVDHFAYISGYPDGSVQPNGNITRAEVATAFYRLLTDARRDAIFTADASYTDMAKSLWYNKAVASMSNGKYVTGYPDGSFGGDRQITRAEFVAMAARFMDAKAADVKFTDVSSSHWAYSYISTAVSYGWLEGYSDGSFKPEQPITRAEAMTIINRMLARGTDADGVMTGYKDWPDNVKGEWYYYEVLEATNAHEHTGNRPTEKWTSLTSTHVYDVTKYEKP